MARLVRSLYGMRDAPALWEGYLAQQLTTLGFQRGRANACVFVHSSRAVRCILHGDDFVFTGTTSHLQWVRRELERERSSTG